VTHPEDVPSSFPVLPRPPHLKAANRILDFLTQGIGGPMTAAGRGPVKLFRLNSYLGRAALLASPFALCIPASLEAQDYALNAAQEPDLSSLSIEQLAQISVRSASKREEPLSSAATALYVITNNDINASAATSLPEVLRLAPNLQVQQIDASQYAITARGFNGPETANKLLVLIDGRTIYTPLQSQVFWNLHSPLLEDIGQIEVISGPGGTLFGPNAVNGVVNITSRDAQDTIGTLARGSLGAYERTAAIRHGLPIGSLGAARIYANWHDREDLADGIGFDGDDAFRGWQAGFRADYGSEADHITVQGDVFDNQAERVEGDGNRGHNLLARWARTLTPSSSFQIQAYYDDFEREFILVRDSLQTFDIEGQFNATSGAHDLVVGGGVRTTRDEFINNLNQFKLDPDGRRLWVYNVFLQDRIRLTPQFALIVGAKVERSSFTGFQFLPNVRLAWQPNEQNLVWVAASRAVRTPSRIDRQLTALPILAPATEFRSEKLLALEAGYRGRPFVHTSLSVSVFYNLYDDVRTTELAPGGGLPIRFANSLRGETYGVEAWSATQLASWWRVSLGVATIWKDFEIDQGKVDIAGRAALGNDPNYQLLARTHLEITPRLQATVGARLVDEIETGQAVDSYVEADARLAYRVSDSLELYVAGRNLLHRDHDESNDRNQAQRVQRSLFAGSRVRF
jgi:iron complex outermembrane receptor protein